MNTVKTLYKKISESLHTYRPWIYKIDCKKRILEIGPLSHPNIRKDAGVNVYYADIRSTEDVKDFYKNDTSISIDDIVTIDYVIDSTYSEVLKDVPKFDYVVATHVIEHIPQLFLFFQDIAKILNPQGKLCLTIPDKRYCFDHFRQPTSFAECFDIYTRGITNLPVRVLDYLMNWTINDPVYWWKAKKNDYTHLVDSKERYSSAQDSYFNALNGEYFDVHFSIFTPETFLMLLYNMLNSNLLPFKCIEFYTTEYATFEFNCVLEFSPELVIDGSVEQKQEKENLLRLLSKNADGRVSALNMFLRTQFKKYADRFFVKLTAYLRKINGYAA